MTAPSVTPSAMLSSFQREPNSGTLLTLYICLTLLDELEVTDVEAGMVSRFGAESKAAKLLAQACSEYRSARGIR